MNSDVLNSISKSLCSKNNEIGPRLYNKNLNIRTGDLNKFYKSDNVKNITEIIYNATIPEYYENSLQEYNTKISSCGALVAYSGIKTGRSPYDKRIVTNEKIWIGKNSPNINMDTKAFNINHETAISFLNSMDKLFVFDGFVCWNKTYRIKVRVISSRAYHCLFMNNMLIRPSKDELKNFNQPDLTIYNAGCFPANINNDNMTSDTSINLNLLTNEVVILGTQYAGEMKKAVFSYLHYLMLKKNILSLHSSCNISKDENNVCLFFGLSGTGKTTLSADYTRMLIGDDEHCWDDNGIFNIEGGCYAKVINLNPDKEKEIYDCIRFGSLLENTILDNNRDIEFNNSSITKNIRLSYPIDYMKNTKVPCYIKKHPQNIILLACDAFGILPLVSMLTTDQAIYHFINGYTSKIAGTEEGIEKPEATFSACYGEAFLVWHPQQYANLLKTKIEKHNVKCWLVNTGWINGSYGIGKRCDLTITRAIIKDIHDGSLLNAEYTLFPKFNIKVPHKYNINKWKDQIKYDNELKNLYQLFENNYSKYTN